MATVSSWVCTQNEQRVRLSLQVVVDWRLGRGEVVLAPQVRGKHVHAGLHLDHRGGFQDQNHRARRQGDQAPDLGHGRAGAVQNHHVVVLQGCARDHHRLRRDRAGVVRQRGAVAAGDRQIRHQQRDEALGGQQGGLGRQEDGRLRGRQGVRRPARHPVPRDLRRGQLQRRAGVHSHVQADQGPACQLAANWRRQPEGQRQLGRPGRQLATGRLLLSEEARAPSGNPQHQYNSHNTSARTWGLILCVSFFFFFLFFFYNPVLDLCWIPYAIINQFNLQRDFSLSLEQASLYSNLSSHHGRRQ